MDGEPGRGTLTALITSTVCIHPNGTMDVIARWTQHDRVRHLGLLLGAAGAVRGVFALGVVADMPLMADAQAYHNAARQMLRAFPGTEPYYWPPGLPYLLALWYLPVGAQVWAARLFAVIVSTVNVALIDGLARRILSEEGPARWAGWMAAVYPPSVLMTSQVVSQPLELTFLLAATLALLRGLRTDRWTWLAGAGLALGAGVLVRPSLLSVVAVLGGGAVVLAYRAVQGMAAVSGRTAVGGALAGSLAVLAVLAPIAAHNHAQGAGWTLSTNNAYNLFLGNNPHTPLYKTNHLASRSGKALPPEVRADLRSFDRSESPQAVMMAEVVRFVREHPGETLLRTTNRMREFWGFDYVASRRIQIAYDLGLGGLFGLLMLEAGGYVVLMLLVLAGLVEGRIWRRRETALVGLLMAGYQIPYWVAFSAGTYHFTAVGLLVPLAAAGAAALDEVRRDRRTLRAPRTLAVAAGLFLLLQVEYAYFTYLYAPVG